ncbi:MAG TPA: hypothetical protein VFA79_15625 [Myxococcales bacterium]|nr:hypothetical protein [Myxococcales bacterium]
MALAAAGSWCRYALERTPRIDTRSVPFLLASAVSGAGLIVTGLCSLRLAPRASRLSRRALWGWALAVQLCGFLALALTSSDVFMNLCFGALSHQGHSPYAVLASSLGDSPFVAPVISERWIHAPSPYGPFFHRLASLAVAAGSGTASPWWGSFWAFKALMLACVLSALFIAARHLSASRTGAAAEVFVVLAMGPLIAWELPGQGHNDGLLILFLIAFLAAAARGRDALAVVALATGICIKYSLAPLLALYLVLVARASIRRAAVLGLLSMLILGGAIATEWHSINLRALAPIVGGDAGRHAHSLTDLVCLVLNQLGLHAAAVHAYRMLSAASMALCLGVLAWTAVRARSLTELARGYLLFLMAMFLTAPWFQPWYCAWALPLLLVEPDPRWRRFLAVYMVITVAQWAAPLDPVTTVAADVWAASQLWRLLKARSAGIVFSAQAEPVLEDPEPALAKLG